MGDSVNLPSGNKYRRYFDQYTICDYKIEWCKDPIPWFNPFKEVWDIIEPTPEWKVRMK